MKVEWTAIDWKRLAVGIIGWLVMMVLGMWAVLSGPHP